ncbi:MAG: hypothetical protein AAGJ81_11285 [Verrucomicrobiota bacterium]
MAPPAEEDEGLVLSVTEQGENFWRVAFLSPKSGFYYLLFRRSKRSGRPDVFDTATIIKTKGKNGSLYFGSEYRSSRHRTGLALSYERIRIASRFANLISRNAKLLPDPSFLFSLSEQFFDSVSNSPAPETAYLKTLYLLAKTEGLPIREDWVDQMDPGQRILLRDILQTSLADQGEENSAVARFCDSLERWLAAEAHFTLP